MHQLQNILQKYRKPSFQDLAFNQAIADIDLCMNRRKILLLPQVTFTRKAIVHIYFSFTIFSFFSVSLLLLHLKIKVI